MMKKKSSVTNKKAMESAAINIITILVIIFFLFPLVWQLISSFKPPIEVTANPPVWFFTPSLESWHNLLIEKGGHNFLFNSMFVAFGTTALSLFFGSLAAFGLARFKFKGRDSLALDFLSFRMFPPIVLAIPLFLIFQAWGLKNTFFGLILAHTIFNLPFTIWLLRGFFMELPSEIEEASLVDGCTRLGFFWRILLPLSTAGLIASGIFCLILSWNEFMLAAILSSESNRTLPVFSAALLEHYQADWGAFAAACILTALPMLGVAFIAQRYIIRGLTYGAVKG